VTTITATTAVTIGGMTAARSNLATVTMTTTTMTSSVERSQFHHHQKQATLMVYFRTPTGRSTSSWQPPKSQEQQTATIERKGDRPCQHQNFTTPAVVGVPHWFLQKRPLGVHT
jgi:hypothetical protein